METIIEEKTKWYVRYMWVFPLGILLSMVIYLIVTRVFYDLPDRGLFGDSFGAINALFTGLAFAFFIISLFMQRDELKLQRQELINQREELRLQREELEQTRVVLKEQRKEMTSQNEIMRKQEFESYFFNLLKLINEKQSLVLNINKISGYPFSSA